jgi:hypothetical protein
MAWPTGGKTLFFAQHRTHSSLVYVGTSSQGFLGGTGTTMSRDEIRNELIEIWKVYKADNVPKVDEWMAKYHGKEIELLRKARHKYGMESQPALAAAPAPTAGAFGVQASMPTFGTPSALGAAASSFTSPGRGWGTPFQSTPQQPGSGDAIGQAFTPYSASRPNSFRNSSGGAFGTIPSAFGNHAVLSLPWHGQQAVSPRSSRSTALTAHSYMCMRRCLCHVMANRR